MYNTTEREFIDLIFNTADKVDRLISIGTKHEDRIYNLESRLWAMGFLTVGFLAMVVILIGYQLGK
jgi:hypothetical protein